MSPVYWKRFFVYVIMVPLLWPLIIQSAANNLRCAIEGRWELRPLRTAVSHSDPACAEAAAFPIVTSGSSDVFLQSSLAKVWAFGEESSLQVAPRWWVSPAGPKMHWRRTRITTQYLDGMVARCHLLPLAVICGRVHHVPESVPVRIPVSLKLRMAVADYEWRWIRILGVIFFLCCHFLYSFCEFVDRGGVGTVGIRI